MGSQILRMMVLLFVLGVSLTACGVAATDGSIPVDDTSSVPVDPSTIDEEIEISGSSTVFPLTSSMAQEFAEDGSSTSISVRSTGTGAGFERFCTIGDIDIVDASRAISDEEQQSCETQGRSVVGFQVGVDALAVVVNAQNDFVDGLSYSQLAHIFSGSVSLWSDLDPNYPSEPIALFSPGTESGTFDYFVEEVFDGNEDPILAVSDITLSEDDNELVDGIATNQYAIGFFGLAYYQDNQQTLRVLSIDNEVGEGSVEPTAETVASGTYPFARPLYIYSSPHIMAEKPHVSAFIQYYLEHVNEVIEEVGYFPVDLEVIDQSQQVFREVTQ
ncbi:MAG: phosphate ABC transporter substrate-binding protein PstS family protein [Chloroflexi bacterium AL-W]|nr:phosphate ABC transporter substrate-binding protein PstS family protein [Chloroflexi bacterium AL-N1]NOK68760.1 phosphate ABC transporter substrate-binding protein PstS family protein [Chloroflexi bacterium AL-N10]NOK76246.1 phosphate ABC transporter substrate-binding protein PstS family protein [Chloroflexi bacterium AL-N5]NOK84117.1 phosphate ABC transporter substrate-binding protein PstS family protein [Chloroflexi bacterium AL-W]NOK91384.1 phosphate ABC transporter substrate-binding prot